MTLPQLPVRPSPPRYQVVAAFAAIYLIWGSTYLAIRVAVETFPPFLLGAIRFLVAGVGLHLVLKLRGTAGPTRRQWIQGSLAGCIMLIGGNGLVNWAEQRVPSNLAALVIASSPVWFVVFDWIRPGGQRPSWGIWTGVLLGLAGVGYLVLGGNSPVGVPGFDPRGTGLLLVATVCWAGGSTLARHTDRPESPWMVASVHMMAAGAAMLGISWAMGEGAGLAVDSISLRSWVSLAYLIVFGSWVAFSAYVWLLEVSSPAKVATYAYVNPVVAVVLGWLLLGETVSARMGAAALVILTAVIILTWPRRPIA